MHSEEDALLDGSEMRLEYSNIYMIDIDIEHDETRQKLEKLLLTKLDRRMSVLVLIYILNYMDRNNASAARLRGFEQDLHLKGSQFATLLSILYVGYIIMQIPSNAFLHHLGKPSVYLPSCMIVWGGLSVATGFVTNFRSALITRFLLGFVEAAFFPGALYLIAKWYKPNELSQRTAYLASGNLLSNAFGSLIASGVMDWMDGVLGWSGWRWLFFVEGTLTILVALWSMSILPDFPETSCSWLTPSEQALALHRISEDLQRNDILEYKLQWQDSLYLVLSDWKVWFLACTMTVILVSLSFNAYFPTLSETLGYGPTVSLILCVPPWVVAVGVVLWISRHSDRTEERCIHIMGSLLLGSVGFVLAMSTMSFVVRYFSLFLMAQSYAGLICFLAWASSSVSHPPAKRAIALALINCVSQLGNVIGSYVWPLSWGPTYNRSYAICTFTGVLAIVMCFFFRVQLDWINRVADNGEAENDVEARDSVRRARPRYML